MKKYILTIAFLFAVFLLKAQAPSGENKLPPAIDMQTDPSIISPEFPKGGPQGWAHFLALNVHYPLKAWQSGTQGKVIIQFVVEEDGSLTNLNVLNSPSDDLSKESLRVISLSPKWKPATKDGKPVRVIFKAPISFALSKQNN